MNNLPNECSISKYKQEASATVFNNFFWTKRIFISEWCFLTAHWPFSWVNVQLNDKKARSLEWRKRWQTALGYWCWSQGSSSHGTLRLDTVWPDLVKFCHISKILKVFEGFIPNQHQNLNLLRIFFYANGQIFIVINGERLKK